MGSWGFLNRFGGRKEGRCLPLQLTYLNPRTPNLSIYYVKIKKPNVMIGHRIIYIYFNRSNFKINSRSNLKINRYWFKIIRYNHIVKIICKYYFKIIRYNHFKVDLFKKIISEVILKPLSIGVNINTISLSNRHNITFNNHFNLK